MNRASIGWAERIYGLVVAIYPRDFREEYGTAMKLVFHDLLKDPDVPAWRIWLSVLRDLPGSVLHEHLRTVTGGHSVIRDRLPSPAVLRRGALFGCAIVLTWITFRGLHLFGGHEVSPQGWAQVRDSLRTLTPWLLFVPAGFVGARTTGTFAGGIWAGLVAGLVALLTIPGDYVLFHHTIPGGIGPGIFTVIAAAAIAMVCATTGAGFAMVTLGNGTNWWEFRR